MRTAPPKLLWPKLVLNEHQWELHGLLRERLAPDRWQVFAGSLLNHFFDPERYVGSAKWLVKSSPVLLAVATNAPYCRAVLIILARSNSEVEAFLDNQKVHWVRYAAHLSPRELADQTCIALRDRASTTIGTRTPISDSEKKVADGFRTGRMIDLIKVHNLEQYLE